jgi:hypothetical protein
MQGKMIRKKQSKLDLLANKTSDRIPENPLRMCVLAANSIFFIALKKLPTPNCLLNDKSSSHFSTRHLFHFLRQLQFGFISVFTTESVKTPPSLFGLSSSFINFMKGTLPLVYHTTAKVLSKYVPWPTLTLIVHLDLFY